MKIISISLIFTLFLGSGVLGQVQLEIVKNPKNWIEAAFKEPSRIFTPLENLQPNLLFYGLNDSSITLRMKLFIKGKYSIQVFENINYGGSSELFGMTTGVLSDTKWDKSISSFKFFQKIKHPLIGGTGGNEFEDDAPTASCKIHTINLWGGAYLDAIQIIWINEKGNLIYGEKHGGNGGSFITLTLRPDENIYKVGGKRGAYIDSIYFITSHGRELRIGGNGGSDFLFFFGNDGGYFSGIAGRSGKYVDAISITGYSDRFVRM
jgi:Jacalin-like lectin domain